MLNKITKVYEEMTKCMDWLFSPKRPKWPRGKGNNLASYYYLSRIKAVGVIKKESFLKPARQHMHHEALMDGSGPLGSPSHLSTLSPNSMIANDTIRALESMMPKPIHP